MQYLQTAWIPACVPRSERKYVNVFQAKARSDLMPHSTALVTNHMATVLTCLDTCRESSLRNM
jgi:hypothetical protein